MALIDHYSAQLAQERKKRASRLVQLVDEVEKTGKEGMTIGYFDASQKYRKVVNSWRNNLPENYEEQKKRYCEISIRVVDVNEKQLRI